MLEIRKFVMAILHWKQELLCDKFLSFEAFESNLTVWFSQSVFVIRLTLQNLEESMRIALENGW